MISVEEARARITGAFGPVSAETVGLAQGLGRVLAEDVVARVTQPPAAVSAMDGYAVRAADVAEAPVTLTQIGKAPAGSAYDGVVGAGQTVRIFTGAPLPQGADSIVIQEDTEAEADSVLIKVSVPEGHYVRRAGLDFRQGDVGIRAGRLLSARDVGLAAAMNVPWLQVRRRPRVAILATGDEVVMPGETIGAHQIVSSNGLALAALVCACGAEASNLGIALDSKDSLDAFVAGARGADLLVTTGGVSVGEHDLLRSALEGLELDFWRIAMRPGKPLLFGQVKGTPILGLPGNPVSALVCGVLFLKPAIRVLLGQRPGADPTRTARLDAALGANDRRQDYLRAHLSHDAHGHAFVTPFERQDSSMMATLAHAECLIVRPPHAPAAEAGDTVEIIVLTGGVLGI
jgi:molybdopterin molybdotransferase